MYTPKFNQEQDLSVLHALIKTKSLASWSVLVEGEIQVNHIPFILREQEGEFGTLIGHVAKANPVWRSLDQDTTSVAVFQGVQAYISPSWYPSKHEHGRAVPTWNYMVVHAHGIPIIKHEPEWLLAHLNELTDAQEANFDNPWKVSDAPDEFIDKLSKAIVGIEISINKINGKWKLGQNRPDADKLGMIKGLASRNNEDAHKMAEVMISLQKSKVG